MRGYIRLSRSGLFAIELLNAAGVFVLCAAVCIGLFVRAEIISAESADLNRAVEEARNAAECWKAAGGDLASVAALCAAVPEQGMVRLYYDETWTRLPDAADGAFCITLLPQPSADALRLAEVTASAADKPEAPLLCWRVAALTGVTP